MAIKSAEDIVRGIHEDMDLQHFPAPIPDLPSAEKEFKTIIQRLGLLHDKNPQIFGEKPSATNFKNDPSSPGANYAQIKMAYNAHREMLLYKKEIESIEIDKIGDLSNEWPALNDTGPEALIGYLRQHFKTQQQKDFGIEHPLPTAPKDLASAKTTTNELTKAINNKHKALKAQIIQQTHNQFIDQINKGQWDKNIVLRAPALSKQASVSAVESYLNNNAGPFSPHEELFLETLSDENAKLLRDRLVKRREELLVQAIQNDKNSDYFLRFNDPITDTVLMDFLQGSCTDKRTQAEYGSPVTEEHLSPEGIEALRTALKEKAVAAKANLAKSLAKTIEKDPDPNAFANTGKMSDAEIVAFINARPAQFGGTINPSDLTKEGFNLLRETINQKKLSSFDASLRKEAPAPLDAYPKLKALIDLLPPAEKLVLLDNRTKLQKLFTAHTHYEVEVAFRECGLFKVGSFEERTAAVDEFYNTKNLYTLVNAKLAHIFAEHAIPCTLETIQAINAELAEADENVFKSEGSAREFFDKKILDLLPNLEPTQEGKLKTAIENQFNLLDKQHRSNKNLYAHLRRNDISPADRAFLRIIAGVTKKGNKDALSDKDIMALRGAFRDANDLASLKQALDNPPKNSPLDMATSKMWKNRLTTDHNFRLFKRALSVEECLADRNTLNNTIEGQKTRMLHLQNVYADFKKEENKFKLPMLELGNLDNYAWLNQGAEAVAAAHIKQGDIKAYAEHCRAVYEGLQAQERAYLNMKERLPKPHQASTEPLQAHLANIDAELKKLSEELLKYRIWYHTFYGHPYSKDERKSKGVLQLMHETLNVKADRSEEILKFTDAAKRAEAQALLVDIPLADKKQKIEDYRRLYESHPTGKPLTAGAGALHEKIKGPIAQGFVRLRAVAAEASGIAAGVYSEVHGPVEQKYIDGRNQGVRRIMFTAEAAATAMPTVAPPPAPEDIAKVNKKMHFQMMQDLLQGLGRIPTAAEPIELDGSVEDIKVAWTALMVMSNGRFGPEAIRVHNSLFVPNTEYANGNFIQGSLYETSLKSDALLGNMRDTMGAFYINNFGPAGMNEERTLGETLKRKPAVPTNAPREMLEKQNKMRTELQTGRPGIQKMKEQPQDLGFKPKNTP